MRRCIHNLGNQFLINRSPTFKYEQIVALGFEFMLALPPLIALWGDTRAFIALLGPTALRVLDSEFARADSSTYARHPPVNLSANKKAQIANRKWSRDILSWAQPLYGAIVSLAYLGKPSFAIAYALIASLLRLWYTREFKLWRSARAAFTALQRPDDIAYHAGPWPMFVDTKLSIITMSNHSGPIQRCAMWRGEYWGCYWDMAYDEMKADGTAQ